jgi:nitrile hydratase
MSGDHEHDHVDGHAHAHAEGSGWAARVDRIVEALERAGIVTGDEVDRAAEAFLAGASPMNGARLVARAWTDPAFAARLLADASAAVDELGIDMTHWARVQLRAVANDDDVHNVIVCTLCSCYPVGLLGPSPSWYKSEAYRARVVREPCAVLAELGVTLPERTRVRVWDSTAELRYIVVPQRPRGTEGMSEAELASRVTREGLIGTALV